MAPQPVEAVFVVFYGKAAHKATYGRDIVGDTSYSKDYIQLIQDAAFREALERLFPRANPGDERTNIEYCWPGGSSRGSIEFQSADRPHLAWLKTVGPPRAWKMTPEPNDETPETIPGDPNHTTTPGADGQLAKLIEQGLQPYLVAVKLRGEQNRLHVRVYIEHPTPALEFADIALLPEAVRHLTEKATRSRNFNWALFDSAAAIVPPEVAEAVERLEQNPCLLLIGPPGVGKTVLLEGLVNFVENPGSGIQFDPDANHDAWSEVSGEEPGIARSIVLHPSYQYENLMLGLLPEPAGAGVTVAVSTGPLVNLAHYASQPGRRALLVLDEFNRANAAAVLGDALALLDLDKRDRAHIDLPYADLPIQVPEEFAANGERRVDPHFTLPARLWIVAAMNTSDRSVAPLDAALRRRFTVVEMQPDYDLLTQHLDADEEADLTAPIGVWTSGHVARLAVELLRALNRRIDAVMGIDFRLGHSNFWTVGGDTVEKALESLSSAFDHRVVPSMRLSLQDDDAALAAILRAGTAEQPLGGAATVAWWVKPDAELGSFASDRLHLREISSLPLDQVLAELRRQAGV